VGGINPIAVEQCLRSGGRVVWMPVVHSLHMVKAQLAGKTKSLMTSTISVQDAITVLDDDGALTSQVREVVALVRDHRAVLATGHISPEEALHLVRFARSEGIERVVVTHPCALATSASVEMQREYAQAGALLEHCYSSCTPGLDDLPVSIIADAIKAVGAEHCLVATDLGQVFNPSPVEGLKEFLRKLHDEGVTERELRTMVRENPSTLFE
jgi:hypothetical protein